MPQETTQIDIQETSDNDDNEFVKLSSRKQYPLKTRVRWSQVFGLSRDYNNESALELLDDMKNLIKNNGVKKNEIKEVNNVECKITDVYNILSDKEEIKKDIDINKIDTKVQDYGAIAILIILYVDRNKVEAENENDKKDKKDKKDKLRYIYHYHEIRILSDEDVNKLNQLRGIIDGNLAVLSNTFNLSCICDEIKTRCLRDMKDKQDRIMEEYLCNISCILNKPTRLLKEKTFAQALYYHMLYSEEIKDRKKMEPTYSHVSFTARFAYMNGIDIYAHPRENSGAYVKVDVKHKKIGLPRLDLQYFCRMMNFLSLALEHTKFVNQHHAESLLTIYDNLIENGEDVEILREYGVLRHIFPSDNDCAEFINSATRNIEHHLHKKLVDELEKLIKKAKSPFNQSIVFFKKENMRNHIVTVSFLGFTLLWITSLVTAIMQTAKAYES